MTTTARSRTAPTPAAEPAPAISALLEIEENSLGTATRFYSSLIGNMVRAQTEVFRFLSGRFAKDAAMLESFASCRNPADVAALQIKIGTDALTDYVAETQRLIGLFEQASNDTPAPAA